MDGDMREEELNLFCCLPKMRIAAKEPVYTARSFSFHDHQEQLGARQHRRDH
jgi:hypothetical protein